jgi:hypothetical protein
LTNINDVLVPAHFSQALRILFDEVSHTHLVPLLAGLLFAAHTRGNVTSEISRLATDLAAAQRATFAGPDARAMMVALTFLGPCYLRSAIAQGPHLKTAITTQLFYIGRLWRQNVDAHCEGFASSHDASVLYAHPPTRGSAPLQMELETKPFVRSVYVLIDRISDGTWGNRTGEVKRCMKAAIIDVYRLESEQYRTTTNNDKELFKWLAMSVYPGDFHTLVRDNTVWKLIVCHWAVLCNKRSNNLWYFKGLLARMYNQTMKEIHEIDDPKGARYGSWEEWKVGMRFVIGHFPEGTWRNHRTDVVED